MKSQYTKILEQINNSNKEYIIGVDEVGYGALAGPICVCAFMAPKKWTLDGVDDSKNLTEKTRERLCDILIAEPYNNNIAFSIVNVHPNSDEYKEYGVNVHGALKFLYWKAVSRVITHVGKDSSLIVLDGSIKFPEYPNSLGESVSLPKADALVQQVGAASIIAKVHRDHYMIQLSKKFTEYKWEDNKGYPSKFHLAALKKYGYCDEHRFSYEPIKSMLKC